MNQRLKLLVLPLVLGAFVALSGCGKDDNNSNSNQVVAAQNSCPAGQTWNGSTCIYTGQNTGYQNCPVGQIWNGSTCVVSGTNTGGGYPGGYYPGGGYPGGGYPGGYYPGGPYNPNPYNQNTACQGFCGFGMVQTVYGCLPQYNCPPCTVFMNGACYQRTF